MSELNVYHHELRHNEYEEFYLKYEADKVIALLKDKANYNECAYKLKSEELADTCRFYEDELRHHKYKRCLAMARWCDSEANYWYDSSKVQQCWRFGHYISWFNKWSKLADQFTDKEA